MAINLKYYIGNLVYPIGSVFVSTKNINPSNIYGGTWEEINDKMLLSNTVTQIYDENTMGSFIAPVVEHEHSLTHTHGASTSAGAHAHAISVVESKVKQQNAQQWRIRAASSTSYSYHFTSPAVSHAHNVQKHEGYTSQTGDFSEEYTNMPPYTVVKMWKRTGLYTN